MNDTNSTLEAQLNFARPMLNEAAARRDIAVAKLAVGLIASALIISLPEEEQYPIRRMVMDAADERSMDTVLDMAAYLTRRSYDRI